MSWDYRGLYGSILSARSCQLDIRAHADDLRCILDTAGVEKIHFAGWSMGVQVGLEFYSRYPERVASLSLLNGTYGRPLRGVPLPFAEFTLGPLIPRARVLGRFGHHVLSRISRSPLTYAAVRKLGVVAPDLDRAHFYRMMSDFQHVDLDVYFELLDKLGAHDAESILPLIQVPTLVLTGAKDVLTPPHLARRMAQRIRHAELFVIPEGTHYAPAEYPNVIVERMLTFISAHFGSISAPSTPDSSESLTAHSTFATLEKPALFS